MRPDGFPPGVRLQNGVPGLGGVKEPRVVPLGWPE